MSLVLFAIIASAGFLGAQTLPMDTSKKVIYTEVVQMPGMTKEKLYERSMKAINAMYKQADKKVAVKDPVGGLLQMNCTTQVVLKDKKAGVDVQSGNILYKFNMYFKEGKYKYEFTAFHMNMGGYPMPIEKLLPPNKPDETQRAPERIAFLDNDIKKLIKIMKDNMSKDQVDVKQDW